MMYLIWLAIIFAMLVIYFRQAYSRFSKYGVRHFKPTPPVGNTGWLILRHKHVTEIVRELYNSFPEERFVGSYEFVKPTILVRDIELIKKIAIKDFEHFIDHRAIFDEAVDPFFGRNLFSLKGQEWKDMRSTLSPAFTSSKIRLMVPFMVEVSDQMIKSLKASIEDSKDNYVDVDCRDMLRRYANDVIASCAFGLKVDSHTDKNNEFYKMGKFTTNLRFKQFAILIALNSFPMIMKKLKFSLFGKKTENFFKTLVPNMMEEREAKKIIRHDMIHLLMEAKKGKLKYDVKESKDTDAGYATVEESDVGKGANNKVWSDEELIAQALLFFFAGFDTVSAVMSFALHEMAANQEVQERLVEEIKQNTVKSTGQFDYNAVQSMVYMDMVVSEVLRKWAPIPALDRMCRKDYNMGKPNKNSQNDYIVRKGETISIPSCAIHRNPEFYTNPNKFDPERFSEVNKHLIKPFTYMPFGLGPRNCIGSRFALCEIKVMLYHLLQNMKVTPCNKSVTEKMDPNSISFLFQEGHTLRFQIRN